MQREKNNLQDLNSVFVFNVPEREILIKYVVKVIFSLMLWGALSFLMLFAIRLRASQQDFTGVRILKRKEDLLAGRNCQTSKKRGGLSFRNREAFNRVLLVKQL